MVAIGKASYGCVRGSHNRVGHKVSGSHEERDHGLDDRIVELLREAIINTIFKIPHQ